jgi:hypothetical protein
MVGVLEMTRCRALIQYDIPIHVMREETLRDVALLKWLSKHRHINVNAPIKI